MHWRLDVGFKENECRIRREQVGENLAVIRHIALNLLSEEISFKAGIKRKKQTVAIATFRKSLQGKGLRNLVLTGMARAKNNGYRCFFTTKEEVAKELLNTTHSYWVG